MGFFSSESDEKNKHASNTYHSKFKKHLKEKDGKQHIVFVHTLSKIFNKGLGVDDKVTMEIDELLSQMQDDGYEVIDVQFTTLKDQGYGKHTNEGYQTMIRYR
ncbi:MAG TPA: hypothetical protein H9891_06380 [Candidatus Salinicoccus stercoripullorum]|uniref:Uncharacterized protein n=1 Tax=Candidatus Salinicoccus stercoripullorum TaxID=2838756 RepID=A0A9D1QGH5_9STAP|nr:hypothetical protein [Candidatus Salinicoccus stercoripullorum]